MNGIRWCFHAFCAITVLFTATVWGEPPVELSTAQAASAPPPCSAGAIGRLISGICGEGLVQVSDDGAIFIALQERGSDTQVGDKHMLNLWPREADQASEVSDFQGRLNVSFGERTKVLVVSSLTEGRLFAFSVRELGASGIASLTSGDSPVISNGIELYYSPSVDALLVAYGIAEDQQQASQMTDLTDWAPALAEVAPTIFPDPDTRAPGHTTCTTCQAGGPGSTGCSISSGGVSCSVPCGQSYYACCCIMGVGGVQTPVCHCVPSAVHLP